MLGKLSIFLLHVLAEISIMCGLTGETGSEEWPPRGNEGFFLVPSMDCKLSPLSASAERARYLHLVDADHSSLRDSHVPKSSSSFRQAPRWGPVLEVGEERWNSLVCMVPELRVPLYH